VRRSTRLVAAAAAALLPLSLAACGDDDDDVDAGDGTTTTATADTTDAGDPGAPEDGDLYQPTDEELAVATEVLEREPPEVAGVDDDVASDALDVSTVIEGEGEREASTGDLVFVHYAGVLADGTPFDDSWSRGQPFDVQLGAGMVITGWDDGLVGARAGDRRRLVIGYDNAYGPEGRPPTIPEEATLVFEIDIVAVIPADA
jgi:peptidylprolyl isomerase